MKTARITTKQLVITALFIALSFVGANIKIFGTIAFDSLPAFLAALVLGPALGAVIGLLGHLATALTSGFPLSLPIHLAVAIAMALTMYVFGWVHRVMAPRTTPMMNRLITGAVGTFMNGPVSLGISMLALWIIAGRDAAMGLLTMLPFLLIASIANIVLAFILHGSLAGVWKHID